MREVGGTSTLIATIRFKNTTINQYSVSKLGDMLKKRRRWVGTCGQDVIPLFWAENWSNQNKERERCGVDLGGRLFAEQRNNKKIAGVSSGGSDGGEIQPGQNVWDDTMSSFRSSNWSTNNKRKKYDAAWKGLQTMLIRTTTNQKQPGWTGEG